MRKIVFVLGNFKNGGMAARATNLANEFALRGYTVDVLAIGEIDENSFISLNDRVRVLHPEDVDQKNDAVIADLEKRYSFIKRIKRVRFFTGMFRETDKKLERKVRFLRSGIRLRPYFILNPGSVAIAFGASYIESVLSATKGLGCRVIYAEKNAPEIEMPSDPEARERMIGDLRSADAVIVQTEKAKEYYLAEGLANVTVINNPLKAGLEVPYKGQRSRRIVNFCRLNRQKNLTLLIEAFRLFLHDYPDYRLEIYGNIVSVEEIKYKEELCSLIAELGIADQVMILPPARDVHARVRDAAMFVSSSDYEGLSNSMIEAMAIGLPCVCTDCLGGGTREVIRDRENGLIVPVNDPESMCRAMAELAENEELSREIGENAARIRETLSVKNVADKWLEIIEKE